MNRFYRNIKVLIPFVYITLLYRPAYSQGSYIKWDKNVKIEWSDFKGKPNQNSPFAAMSAIGINYKYNSWSNGKVYKLRFDIYSNFDRTRSWSKARLRTKSMLGHEQLHFDIGALVSKAFKKEVERRTYGKNYKNEIVSIFNRYSSILQKLQQKYDLQTVHGNNKTKQKEWERLIHKSLTGNLN